MLSQFGNSKERVERAIFSLKNSNGVILVDDEDRENEGDFICAAQCVTPEIINFMATHGRGLICAPLDEKRVEELKLQMMVKDNTALHETAFTVSIDLIGYGCTTGISAQDRATGIRALINPSIKAEDYARPGHIFPLKAKTGGVLRRSGHTEAAIDLALEKAMSCIIVPYDILLDYKIINYAKSKEFPIITTGYSSYKVCSKIYEAFKERT